MNEQDPVNDYGHFPKIVVDFSYILHQLFFFWLPIGFVSTLQHAINFVSYDGLNRSGQIINATDVQRLEQSL